MPPAEPDFVSVRGLCDFTARAGDLDLTMRPTATALEGLAIHRQQAEAATAGRRHEVFLSVSVDTLTVRGRADVIDDRLDEVEEIKSYRGDRARIPAMRMTLHWAQVETYAALHAITRADAERGSRIGIALRMIEIDSGESSLERRIVEIGALIETLHARAAIYAAWAAQERLHRADRDTYLSMLAFPHGAFREGQRELAAAVYRCAVRGRQVLAQAPTGLGKSIAAVFGALKGLQAASLDKLFMLTCRTTGAAGLMRALEQCNGQPAGARPLRVLELASRERACVRPGAACTPQACDLAVGFHDRLPAARAAAVAQGMGAIDTLAGFETSHRVCPWHLAQELVAWADVVVADVNHWFDRHAGLHAMVRAEGWKVAVVVDEAHNLVDRTRGMYTASFSRGEATRLAALLPQVPAIGALARSWRRMETGQPLAYQELNLPQAFRSRLEMAAKALGAVLPDFAAHCPQASPADLDSAWALTGLNALLDEAGDGDAIELLRALPLQPVPGRDVARPRQTKIARGPTASASTLRVRCIVPSAHLVGAWAAAQGTTLMSATLRPFDFHRQLLGLNDDAVEFECASPWRGQLQVVVRSDVSTRWRDRTKSSTRIAELVVEVIREAPGNYMVFASSYAYLQLLRDAIGSAAGALAAPPPMWVQAPRMRDADKASFLDRFEPDGVGLGFAVLGGGFSEGVDLIGSRLCGAFVATLGLPQVDEANEVARRLIDRRFGDGWALNYLIPGLTKVGQAGGRIIRTASDRGVLYLLDDRYALRHVREALPTWWFADPSTAGESGFEPGFEPGFRRPDSAAGRVPGNIR